jgi:hypothetical protein
MQSVKPKTVLKAWAMAIGVALVLAAGAAGGAGLPKKGDTLPGFEIQSPPAAKARSYLGISRETFRLGEVGCRVLLLEVIGVYCPQCYRQAPLFNNLFGRIEKGRLKGQVKMLALAAGGAPNEIQYLYEQVQYSFPVVADPRFDIHKLLGEPRTPFILLVDPRGKVLYTHMGVIEDMDAFYKLINELVN